MPEHNNNRLQRFVVRFIQVETLGGLLMSICTLVALGLANSKYHLSYNNIIDLNLKIELGKFLLAKPLQAWVNDLLMTLFFVIVTLEIKAEIIEGNLSERKQAILPFIATLGGVIGPAAIYYLFTHNHAKLLTGWAVTVSTDIAFALCVLSMVGKNLPPILRIFLMTLAVCDDLIGILIIAIFYTETISTTPLLFASFFVVILLMMNLRKVEDLVLYMMIGFCLWVCMLHSGIHPTIAGVILAMTVPMKLHNSPLKRLMHILHPWVNYLILPIFAFSNAGIRLINISSDMLLAPLTIAVMISLIAGKTFGVFLSSWLCIKMKFAELPPSLKFSQLFGVSIITGIGFTISLFIAQLAFSDPTFHMQAKIGVMAGSLFSAVIGYIVLVMVSERERN